MDDEVAAKSEAAPAENGGADSPAKVAVDKVGETLKALRLIG